MATNWEKLSVLLEVWVGAGTLAVTTMAISTDPTIMATHHTTLAPLDSMALVTIGEFYLLGSIFKFSDMLTKHNLATPAHQSMKMIQSATIWTISTIGIN